MLEATPFPEFEKSKAILPTCDTKDEEDIFLELIDYVPQCKVEIAYNNGAKLSFNYWASAKDFFRVWDTAKGKEITLVVSEGTFITINKSEVIYKIVTDLSSANK